MNQTKETLRVLGIDPGFTNLGLAILDAQEGPSEEVVQTVIFTDCVTLGSTDSYRSFPKKLKEVLDSLWDQYGPFDTICAEEPTEIQGNPVVSSYLWFVYGLIRGWAVAKGVDDQRALTPTQLKNRARALMWDVMNVRPETTNPTKAEIAELLHHLKLPRCRTNHEDDAVLAVISNLGKRQS